MAHPGMQPVFATMQGTDEGAYQAEIEMTMSGDWFFLLSGVTEDGLAFEEVVPVPGVRPRK